MNAYGGPLLLDMSAWARVLLGRLPPPDQDRFESAVRAREVLTCEPFLLEALYSSRNGNDYDRLSERLDALPFARSGPETLRLALRGQSRLAHARGVSHRVKPVDLLVAAVAHEHAFGVLHYDRDYETIAEHSGLRVRSTWIAAAGSVS